MAKSSLREDHFKGEFGGRHRNVIWSYCTQSHNARSSCRNVGSRRRVKTACLARSRGDVGTAKIFPETAGSEIQNSKADAVSGRQKTLENAGLTAHYKSLFLLVKMVGGEGGIRTHGALAGTPHFECGTIDHSATAPEAESALTHIFPRSYDPDEELA